MILEEKKNKGKEGGRKKGEKEERGRERRRKGGRQAAELGSEKHVSVIPETSFDHSTFNVDTVTVMQTELDFNQII